MLKRISILSINLLALFNFVNGQNTYNEVTLPELMKKKQQDDKNMVIVDVRTRGEYGDTSRGMSGNIGRIKDAINIPVGDLRANPEAVKQLEPYRDKDIYLICSHSYRSRTASNILLKNGFTHVNNIRGGMTEWYRRYDELSQYMNGFLERGISYKNMAPSQLLDALLSEKKVLLLGIRNSARMWYDSFNLKLYRQFPLFKSAVYFDYADSLKILNEANKDKERPVILFNMVNTGAAELAEWLTKKGVPDVSYLVGGLTLFYEFVSDKPIPVRTELLFTEQNTIRFITPVNYCTMTGGRNMKLIDIRHDSLFNKVNQGTKHDFKHLKNAINFFAGKEAALFQQQFPDRKTSYVLISDNGIDGLELATALAREGYKISWMIGGLNSWEWYMNNVEDFRCNDLLVE